MSLRNILLAGSLTALTACGGGGGGPVNDVRDWVDNDLTNLEQASENVDVWTDIVSDLEKELKDASPSALVTGPTAEDMAKANNLLEILARANTEWAISNAMIDDLPTDAEKYTEFNKSGYKKAYQAIQFLNNNVKPLLEKVASGQAITMTEFKLIDDKVEADKIINTYDAESYALQKSIKKTETISNDTSESTDATGTSTVSYSDWTTVHAGGGDETRTKTTTTTNIRTTVSTRCTFTRTTLLNNTTSDGAQTCVVLNTTTTDLDPTITTETETREGENPVIATEDLDPTISTQTESSAEYTETSYTDADNTTTETEEGSSSTNTANRDVTTTTDHGDNTSTVVVTRYVDTTTTTPITTRVYRTRHYTDVVKKDTRIITTTTTRQQLTYKDGTTEIVNGNTTTATGDWTTTQLSESTRSENLLVSESTAEQVITTSDAGTQISSQDVSNAYTDNDIHLGTKTNDISSVVADHKTFEYKSNTGLDMINAANAYAKGWTGEGAVLGVIDTWQDTTHEKLNGKYLYYKDYDPYNNTVNQTQNHGTKVASIIAGSRDGDSINSEGRLTTGDYTETEKYLNGTPYTEYSLTKNNDMHGVAFDSKLVGANVDRFSNGNISKGQAQSALHDFAKLKSPEADGGEEMNIVAVNMSFNTPQLFYNGWNENDSTVTQLNDGTFNASEVIQRIEANGWGDAKYWKVATDNDIILVNSAGNKGYAHAGDPGIWAVEENADGSLVLGGKMVIVGTWDGTGVSGNKAGHVCLKIDTINNVCNDKHRLSEFYILAPGNNIMGADPGNEYSTGSGTSFAAPHVTGAFGVLNQMWPYMKGDNLVKLVMNTADKNLTGYNVNIHGQGLLDLDEATKPQGAVGIVTTGRVDHPIVNLNNTYYSTGTALPSSLSNLRIMVLDDYDRNYYLNIGSSFVVQDKRKISDIDVLKNGYFYLPYNNMYGNFAQGGQYDLGYLNFGLYTGENGNGDYTANIGKKFFIGDKFAVNTNIGTMNERETWLGNKSDGILSVGENNTTNFASIGASYQIGNNVLSIDYTRGNTDINTVTNSLITAFSDVQTESYRLAYEVHKDENNTLGWSFSLPSHITSGNMDLEVAESVNLDGSINYTTINSDLSNGSQERNIGFFYNHIPTNDLDASFNFTAEYRQNISGVADNNGIQVGMNYAKKFFGSCKFLWMKNPKCYDKNGKMKSTIKNLMQGTTPTNFEKHGLVYDMKTDKFILKND